MKIAVVHGVNLNFTGTREPSVYGLRTLEDINASIQAAADGLGCSLAFFQSNIEGEIVNFLQQCYHNKTDGVVINPGAFTHYSYALHDAIASIGIPAIEVHLSNIHRREEFRRNSVVAPVCAGQICGLGAYGYVLAIMALIHNKE
ncbi:MAG: type II 3-dehydroquinate dehydratase [Clostridiales bacterium]|jgi:3-dehydroquinate dehydratase-2|nr:type II 3-dehydroquinate dehydratase [Clostridiales bacterium]